MRTKEELVEIITSGDLTKPWDVEKGVPSVACVIATGFMRALMPIPDQLAQILVYGTSVNWSHRRWMKELILRWNGTKKTRNNYPTISGEFMSAMAGVYVAMAGFMQPCPEFLAYQDLVYGAADELSGLGIEAGVMSVLLAAKHHQWSGELKWDLI